MAFLLLALTSTTALAQIHLDDGNVGVRVPRDNTVTYQREGRDEVSLFDVQTRMLNLEKWKETDFQLEMAKGNVQIALDTVSQSVTATQAIISPVVLQIQELQKSLNAMKLNLPNQITTETSLLDRYVTVQLDGYNESTTQLLNKFQKNLTGTLDTMAKSVDNAKTSVAAATSKGTQAINDATASALGKITPANWCFKWANGIDDYNPSWRPYPGMVCSLTSKTGWVRITLEGRVYGCNHGGFRVTGGGQMFGKEGTYGFQWMNNEHYGHRWTPFNIVRWVKTDPGKAITYRLEFRAQANGCRFHISGGNYGQEYSGLWFSMEEMAEPMSRS